MGKRWTRGLLLIACLVLLLGFSQAAFGQSKLYLLDQKDGTSFATAKPVPAFGDAGVKGWTVQAVSDAGVDYLVFAADPNATMDAHQAPDEYVGLILEGSMTVVLTDAKGVQKSTATMKKGDMFIFRANVMHAWKNGPAKTLMLFVKQKAAT